MLSVSGYARTHEYISETPFGYEDIKLLTICDKMELVINSHTMRGMVMKQIIKRYIKSNPKCIYLLTWLYNNVIGRNRIMVSNKNNTFIGAVLISKTKFKIKGRNNKIIIKDFSKLTNCIIYISGSNNTIQIDGNVLLNKTELHIEDDNNEIVIGEGTSITGLTNLSAIEGTSIKIGKNCLFSSDIYFSTGDSHSITTLDQTRLNKSENIIIGDHVWVGTRVVGLKGVSIPNNCVVGSSSLLNKKFIEENVVLAGNPAQIIKREINWLVERI
ncbi:acyltransferase [Paenibacillus sp. FSL L8-0470]|uniref:acyltransferase n=1 Tax=Paenibacillus sp. FSL L8-0470 TaxID=2954688 RepID=UPI0030F9A2E7